VSRGAPGLEHGTRVGVGAEHEDAVQVFAGRTELSRLAARADDEPVEILRRAAVEFEETARGIQPNDRAAVHALDLMALVEVVAPKEHPLLRCLTLQKVLAAVWPVVGSLGLAGDHEDATAEVLLAEGLDGVLARGAAAEHDERAGVRLLAPAHRQDPAVLGFSRYADNHVVSIYPNFVHLQGVQTGRLELVARGDMEARVMPGADDALAAQDALGQGGAVVGTVGLIRVETVVAPNEKDDGLADGDLLHLAVGEIGPPGNDGFIEGHDEIRILITG